MSRIGFVRLLPDASLPVAQSIVGQARFIQPNPNTPIQISLFISGLPPNTVHGWHIHNTPLRNGPVNCTRAGPHFNPRNAPHGSPRNDPTRRHVGDLGNFKTDANGSIRLRVADRLVTLYGNESVNNLALVVHERADDLGLGNNNASKTIGNTGMRLACGNIQIPGFTTPTLTDSAGYST